MSTWYIFSILGFYPVAPDSDVYAFGSPAMKSVALNLENGNKFKVIVENQSKENVFVDKILLNRKELKQPFIKYSDIEKRGELNFHMSNSPNKTLYK